MPILIDGHNLIGCLSGLSLRDPDDEEKLVGMLRSYQARTGKTITVVFDPGWSFALSQSRRIGRVEIVFASQGSSADAVISRRVQRSRNPDEWLVVTSDRGLAERVAQGGARVRSAEAFAAELETAHRGASDATSEWKDAVPSPEDVESWLALFEGRD